MKKERREERIGEREHRAMQRKKEKKGEGEDLGGGEKTFCS